MSILKISWPVQWIAIVALGIVGVAGLRAPLYAAESPVVLPPPLIDNPKVAGVPQTAVLAGGCFWGVQGVFEHVRGVQNVLAGFSGGDKSTAQYATVSSGKTGHAESVKITFDPAQISYGQILQIAFSVVFDPTQLNRQGPDVGTQYRSAIFYADETQKHIAETYISQLDQSHALPRSIVTRVDPYKGFYPAEDYHQDYLIRNPTAAMFDLPKIEKLKHSFPELYSSQPVLANAQ
jgi:peptide-methionine (S)-S-oxide reductase